MSISCPKLEFYSVHNVCSGKINFEVFTLELNTDMPQIILTYKTFKTSRNRTIILVCLSVAFLVYACFNYPIIKGL